MKKEYWVRLHLHTKTYHINYWARRSKNVNIVFGKWSSVNLLIVTTLSFCGRVRGACKCTGTRCHAAVGFLVAEKDNNSFCQWGRKGVKKKQWNMEGEVTQWDASSVLFTRNQHYGHVYRAHSLSCGWEGRSLPSAHPITYFFLFQNWPLIMSLFMRGITKDSWNTARN